MDTRSAIGWGVTASMAAAGPAGAQQWHATVLPSGSSNANARAVFGPRSGGKIGSLPVLWQGAAGAVNNLLPAGSPGGAVLGMSATHQVGGVGIGGEGHAALWSGTAASFVDLHPGPQGAMTTAVATFGQEQVGVMIIAHGPQQASVWHGTAASYVNLHPAGANSSSALATDGTHQGGFVIMVPPGFCHAALWSGTAASFVDLNPPGAGLSIVWAMAPGVQVGHATGSSWRGATLWTGSPSTGIDMNPPGASFSRLYATAGTVHAGEFQMPAASVHAGLWFGTSAAGFMDLHALLPPGYESSTAYGVYEQDGRVSVVGVAYNGSAEDAILWTNACYANCDASTAPPVLSIPDFVCFLNRFSAGDEYANCDGSTLPPTLNVGDFMCFLNAFASGCS